MLNIRSLCALFFMLLLCAGTPASGSPTEALRFRTPAAFVELPTDSILFQESAQKAVRHGKLLKLYLPREIAVLHDLGRKDAVTRQVLVCGLEDDSPIDQKTAELLARSMEGFFNGFTKLPRLSPSASSEEKAERRAQLAVAMQNGTPLLTESLRTASAYLHTCIIHFPMSHETPGEYLSLVLGMGAVPVGDTILFITASSILSADDPESHLLWAKETVSSFADAIDSANRQEKK